MKRSLLLGLGLVAILTLTLALLTPNVGTSLSLLAQGAFGDKFGLSRTLVKWTPLTLCALGIIVAWRAGMYNIGGEGQFVVGGICGAAAAKLAGIGPNTPWAISAFLILTTAVAGGAAWGALAGWLYVRRGVEVVISTILLNFVAIQGLAYLVSGPLQEAARKLPQSDRLAAPLPRFDPQTDLHAGVILVPLVAAALAYWLFVSVKGYQLRLVGANAKAARANRIEAPKLRLLAMSVSGGLCGLAGGIEYMGVTQQLGQSFSQSWGFLAIPVALLAFLHPLAALASGLFFAAVLAGSKNLAGFTADGTVLIYIVQGVAVLGFLALQAWPRNAKEAK